MATNKEIKSNRLLQSRRYTLNGLADTQEAFTQVLDLNADEIYSQQTLIPTSSLPFSGSSQNGGTTEVTKYWYRHKLTKANDGTNTAWFFLTSYGGNDGIGAQLIDNSQETNFISPKYSIASLTNANAEDATPGYNVRVFVSTNASTPAAGDVRPVTDYTYNYKYGVLNFENDPPTNSEYVYVTAYQYTGRTLASDQTAGYSGSFSGSFEGSANLRGDFSGSFEGDGNGLTNIPASGIVGLNLTQIATGLVTASVAGGSTAFSVVSGSSTLLRLTNAGDLHVSASEFIGNNITAVGNATITGSLIAGGNTTLEQNLTVQGGSTFLNDVALTGSLEISQNLVVQGTASFGYLNSVSGSAKIIGDAYIILNSDLPSQRYAGLIVIDSGSSGQTGSLLYDAEADHWFYDSTAEGYASGFIAGPRASRDNITWPSRYAVTRGDGGNHIVNSNIYSTGSYVTINKGGTGSLGAEVDILGSVVITGSTLESSPDGEFTNKYALVVSQSAWHYSDNVGYPAGDNQWNSGLDGSYFNIFNQNTDTATILRFLAGLLSASAPAPTPNTREYSSVGKTENNLGSTETIYSGILSSQRLSLGYTSSGQISTEFKDAINYGIAKGWSTAGVDGNGEGERPWELAGSPYKSNFNTYNFTFTSTAGSGTGGNGDNFFGLGTLDPAKNFKVRMEGSMSFSDNSTVTNPDQATGNHTEVNTVDLSRSVATNTNLDGNGLAQATIFTENPSVIPNTYQDARFLGVGGTTFLTRSYGAIVPAATATISSSGYYRFYGMQVGITSGSSTDYIYKTTGAQTRLWMPVDLIQASMSASPAAITGGTFASSSLTIAPSRSYSGVPYLTAGTSTWAYLGTGSGMFDPAFLNGVVFRQSIAESLPGTVTIAGSSNSDVSCNSSGIATSGKVYDASGNVKNSGLPRVDDEVRSNVVITHSISSGNSNISETGFSTGTTFTGTTTGYPFSGGSGTGLNTSTFPYHEAGTYGQPSTSGSLGIYGGGSSNNASVEYFTSESYRRIISDSTTLTTQWDETTALTLGDGGDLQVKPSTTTGYLVNPESTKGYWYPQTGYNSNHYKWYMREITTNAAANRGSITLDFDPNTSADFVDFTSTTTGKIALGLLFEYQVATKGGNRVVMYDVIKGNGSYGGGLNNLSTSTQYNPFSDNIDIQADFSSISNSSGTITLGLNNPVNQKIDGTYTKVWLLVRYKGTPGNSLQKLTVTVG